MSESWGKWARRTPGRRSSKCKSLEIERGLIHLRKRRPENWSRDSKLQTEREAGHT